MCQGCIPPELVTTWPAADAAAAAAIARATVAGCAVNPPCGILGPHEHTGITPPDAVTTTLRVDAASALPTAPGPACCPQCGRPW